MQESISAEDKSIGFDYQYYYFLLKLLNLKKGETVGLEVKDDVHCDLANDHQILVQLKHTTQTGSTGKPSNLTTLDSDLWKTLSNWAKIILDKNVGRNEVKNQEAFLKKTEFLLVSNKSETSGNKFFEVLNEPAQSKLLIKKILDDSKGETTKQYINNVLSLSDKILIEFINRVKLELETDDIIQKCKDAIDDKEVPPESVEKLFRDLDSQIRQDNFIRIRNGEKISISKDDFKKKYRRFFDLARSKGLKIKECHKPLPSALNTQTFIKQLLDIGDISVEDTNSMAKFTRYMFQVEMNLHEWNEQGNLTVQEIKQFQNEAKIRWENKFRSIYRNNEDSNELAQNLIDYIREIELRINELDLGIAFSNGEYYRQSNIPELGWEKDWKDKFK